MLDIAIVERWFRNKKRDFWQESDTVFTRNPIPDFLEQFQLHGCMRWLFLFVTAENFDCAELFVGYRQYADLSGFRKKRFYSFDMHCRIFPTRTMAHIDGILEHNETVADQFLPEFSSSLALLFSLCREVEKYKYPHNTVFIQAFHNFRILDRRLNGTLRCSICRVKPSLWKRRS